MDDLANEINNLKDTIYSLERIIVEVNNNNITLIDSLERLERSINDIKTKLE